MGKSPSAIDRQNTRNAAAASSNVAHTIHGRHTNDARPTRTPRTTVAITSS
ncbi:hypothetical protein [Nonomuraea salmonea]|uniref:hypothetical protein n=1 Tax=Nonomuraea salmonea TaxID=46181 RepID=UPI0031E8289C